MHLSQVKISNTSRDRATVITFLNVCSGVMENLRK